MTALSATLSNPSLQPDSAFARATGLLSLSLVVLAPFSMIHVPSKVLVPGDAAATMARLIEHGGLYRAGIVVDTAVVLIEVVLTAMLFRLFEQTSRTLSLMSTLARLTMAVLMAGNVAVSLLALRLAGQGLSGPALLALEAHADVALVWQALCGWHCGLLGVLVWRSGKVPRWLGALLIVAAAGYLSDSFGRFASPLYADKMGWLVALSGFVGELPFTVWLVARGVKGASATPSQLEAVVVR